MINDIFDFDPLFLKIKNQSIYSYRYMMNKLEKLKDDELRNNEFIDTTFRW